MFKRLRNITGLAFLLLLLVSCERQDEIYIVGNPNGPDTKDIIRFLDVSPLQLEADGVSLSQVRVRIHPEADASARTICFTLSGGNFLAGDTVQSVTANIDGIASASFVSNKGQSIILKATVLNFTIDTTIRFTQAYPDDMILSAEEYVVDTASDIQLTAGLFRNPGRGEVHEATKVYFEVMPDSTQFKALVCPAFAFSNPDTAAVTVRNPLRGAGSYTIKAKTVSATGDTLRRNIWVVIRE